MTEPTLLHTLIAQSASRAPQAIALRHGDASLTYAELEVYVQRFAAGLMASGLARGERIAIYLEKRFEAVVASFGAAAAGLVFVPVNPVLKPDQVAFILRDCNVRLLVTSPDRCDGLLMSLSNCPELAQVVLTDSAPGALEPTQATAHPAERFARLPWAAMVTAPSRSGHRVLDGDMASILYTSGSTGSPKGVVLSHRNLVLGAKSVAAYLENGPGDTLLAALPLSFDAGFSQLTTAFSVGARVVLLNYLMPKDVIKTLAKEQVTGLTAVPPLYIQLAQLDWPVEAVQHLRYFANTGGHMPLPTLTALRAKAPKAKPFLMYGLTEAFRSTYLPPHEVDRRPDSIGKAIPNVEVLVLRPDGTPCAPHEPGELVHRGPLVSQGYWNSPERTAERFKILPERSPGRQHGLTLPEYAVFSGDTVRQDEDGFLFFVGRTDEMIKTSGYRVSPTEVEDVVYATGLVGECVAVGIAHPVLGSAIILIATQADSTRAIGLNDLNLACREKLPAYMVPLHIEVRLGCLPRNPNGKIDRKLLASEMADREF